MEPGLAAFLVLVGVVSGVTAGLFGVGGGILMVPALHYVVGQSWADSVAASLLVMAFTTPAGMGLQHAKGFVRWREGALLAAAGIAGVLGASLAERFLPVLALKFAFSVLLLLTAYRLAKARPRPEPLAPPVLEEAHPRRPETGLLLLAGVAAGFIAKLLGIGGGLVMVPALVFLAVPIHAAVATSLLAVFVNALVATGVNLWRASDWLSPSWWLLAGGLPGIALGVMAAHRSRPKRLQLSFALVLAAVALYVLVDAALAARP